MSVTGNVYTTLFLHCGSYSCTPAESVRGCLRQLCTRTGRMSLKMIGGHKPQVRNPILHRSLSVMLHMSQQVLRTSRTDGSAVLMIVCPSAPPELSHSACCRRMCCWATAELFWWSGDICFWRRLKVFWLTRKYKQVALT